MPKYRNHEGRVETFPKWVVESLEAIIFNNKLLNNGGWVLLNDPDKATAAVVNGTKAKSNKAKSNEAKSNEAKSNEAKSNEAKSNEAKSIEVESEDLFDDEEIMQ